LLERLTAKFIQAIDKGKASEIKKQGVLGSIGLDSGYE
jgi:hypothetical protein